MALQDDKVQLVKAIADEATIAGIQWVILEYLYTGKPQRVWQFRVGEDWVFLKGDEYERQPNRFRILARRSAPMLPDELKFRVAEFFKHTEWLSVRLADKFSAEFTQTQLDLIGAIIKQHDYTDMSALLLGWLVNANLNITFCIECANSNMEIKAVSRDELVERLASSGKVYFRTASILPKVDFEQSYVGESAQDIITFMNRVQENFIQLKAAQLKSE